MTPSATIEDEQLVIRLDVSLAAITEAQLSSTGKSKILCKTDLIKVGGMSPLQYKLMVIAPLSKLGPSKEAL